jgi:hypothetical protein
VQTMVSARSPSNNEAPRTSSGCSASFVIAEQEPPAQKHLQPLGVMPREVRVFKSLVLLPTRTLPLVHGDFLASRFTCFCAQPRMEDGHV